MLTFGAANQGPVVGPVVLGEIMYRPPDLGGSDNVANEFIATAVFGMIPPSPRHHLLHRQFQAEPLARSPNLYRHGLSWHPLLEQESEQPAFAQTIGAAVHA